MDPRTKDSTTQAGTRNEAEPQAPGAQRTYQMLWDCPHCMTKKNLGLSHRHCPNCGGPQDASWRYFPSDDEKVAVEEHEYAGADLQCGYCGGFNGRRCQHCVSCGAPLQGASDARTRQEQVTQGLYGGETQETARQEFCQPNALVRAARQRRIWPWVVGALGVVVVIVGIALVFGVFKRDADLQVAGHSWKREIVIERFGLVQESNWCDGMPRGATNVNRSREVRSHRQVANGQDCRTRRKDRGDGTYTESQQCTTRYKQEPVYDEKCSYSIEKWSRARSEERAGSSPKDEPRWPEVKLTRSGQCLGCEREGARKEEYVVQFVLMGDGEKAACQLDQSRWASLAVGSKWRGKVSVVGSSLDCSELKPL